MSIKRRSFIKKAGVYGSGLMAANAASMMLTKRASAAKEITTTFMKSGTYDLAAESIENSFEKETGIDLEIITSPWAVLNQNHIADLTTGTGEFDVMSGEFWIASVFNHMLPLDGYVNNSGYGSTIINRLWEPGPSNFFNGKRIGVPHSADAYSIIYRKDIFEKYNIDPNWTTWKEYLYTANQLKNVLKGQDIAPISFAWGAPDQAAAIFLGAYDGMMVNSKGEYELEKDKAIAALNLMMDTANYGPSNAKALSIDESNAVFLDGKAATLICWPSFVRSSADKNSESNVVGKWELGNWPGPGFPMVSAWNLFISKYSSDPDSAWKWIEYHGDSERSKQFMEDFGIGSPHRTTYEDKALLRKHGHDYPGMLSNLSKAKSLPWIFEAYEVFFRNVGELMSGNQSSSETVDKVHEAWSSIKVPAALIETAESQGLKG